MPTYTFTRPGHVGGWILQADSDRIAIQQILLEAPDTETILTEGRVIWPVLKSLFDANERYTYEANQLTRETVEQLKPLLERWLATHRSREVEYVVQQIVADLVMSHRIGKG